MYEVEVRAPFEAAHKITGYAGKCARLHGHNWEVTALVRGEDLDALGMLIDFRVLKGELRRVLEEFDHRFLNELATFERLNPTAEHLARVIYERLKTSEVFKGAASLYAVKVCETAGSQVTYHES